MERQVMVKPGANSRPLDMLKIKKLNGALLTLKTLQDQPFDWLNLLTTQGSKVMVSDILECLSILDGLRLHEQKKLD